MKRNHLLSVLAVVAVTATACGAVAADSVESAPSGNASSTLTADDEPTPATELVSPTETDRPFDLSGGAESSNDGVTVATGSDTRVGLKDDVRRATDPWETDWGRRTADLDGLLLGIGAIDPRDRIPPIDTPKFEPIAAATWLDEREPGALVQLEGETRFYPLSILTRHEIVNDRFDDIPVAVTFCPLCNTALAFDTRVDGQALRLGVSGLLRNSDMVMWDDATTTLWQQITGEAIVGELAGTQLELISTAIVSYRDARENFPDALSLARDTGFNIEYGANPYVGYSSSSSPFLFDGEPDPRFRALSRVVGVTIGATEKAYPFGVLAKQGVANDEIEGVPIAVFWGGQTADALDRGTISSSQSIGTGIAFDRTVDGQVLTFASAGDDRFSDAETGSVWSLLGLAVDGPLEDKRLELVTHRNEFWFAWAAFFPDAEVYELAAV